MHKKINRVSIELTLFIFYKSVSCLFLYELAAVLDDDAFVVVVYTKA